MTTLLVILTVIEIALFLGVVAVYLHLIGRSLTASAGHLAKVAFGVRAIDTQTAPIGPAVVGINERLTGIAAALDEVAGLAEQAAGDPGRGA